MPKVELHLHLEGAIPLTAMWELVQRHGGDPELPSPSALSERFAFRDFDHFIETWVWKNRFLTSDDDFTFLAESVARDLSRQHIVYAEVFFSPTDFAQHGLAPQDLAVAIRKGLDRVPEVDVGLIVDLVRDTGPHRAAHTLAAIGEVATDTGVLGIGIGGSEAEYPPEAFEGVYRSAADDGFHLTAHAGEAAGPESVWGALRALKVERIGHGIRSAEDPALMDHLVDQRIPLEVCLTSNLRTGVVQGWACHPARELIEAGAMVTINTDDPAMFDCSLAGEYRALVEHLGLDRNVVRLLAGNAVDASWAPSERKAVIRARLDEWFTGAGAAHR